MPPFQLKGGLVAAAHALRRADALIVTAGAGMGVDSGLPDFRGNQGLWRAYPPLREKKLDFASAASPGWFESDPNFAWGFYGHRLNLYRDTVPHEGFARLLRWGCNCKFGNFVFTSNVDGQFQKAGFHENSICECHGSIHWLQDLDGDEVWSAEEVCLPSIDSTILLCPDKALPRSLDGEVARPNILMFGDWSWNGSRTQAQNQAFREWIARVPFDSIVVVEIGAGEQVPTVRRLGDSLAKSGAVLIRINPRDPHVPKYNLKGKAISIPLGARQALELIDKELERLP